MMTAPIMIQQPRHSDGVGHALRSAFRGRLEQVPQELLVLLNKLN